MAREFAYVNEKQHQQRVDRALLRYQTLRHGGAPGRVLDEAEKKIDDLEDARDVMRGGNRYPHPRGNN